MIKFRYDIKDPRCFPILTEALKKHIGECGKNWSFDICTQEAYGDTEDEQYSNWNTRYYVDVSIRSHKKATMFALIWKGIGC